MATFKKILIAYDGSQPCRRAAEQALALAVEQGADVIGLKVISFSFETIVPSDNIWENIVADLKTKANTILDDLEAMAKERGVTFIRDVREGGAENEIVLCAEENGADLIVLGIGSRATRLGRFMGKGQQKLGLRTLVLEASCPVMVLS
ncbi:MAG: universal stress protein [Candidatus Polarisedimenticolaceae bacterium]|nr:universal stress protein [Candidatus Polarisedimenticolaceae bacterium]